MQIALAVRGWIGPSAGDYIVAPRSIWRTQSQRLCAAAIFMVGAVATTAYMVSPAGDWLFYGTHRMLLAAWVALQMLMGAMFFLAPAVSVARQSIRRDGDSLEIITAAGRPRVRHVRIADILDLRICNAARAGGRGYLAIDVKGSFVPVCVGWPAEKLVEAEAALRRALRMPAPTAADAVVTSQHGSPVLLNYEPLEVRASRVGETIMINLPQRWQPSRLECGMWVFFFLIYVLPAAICLFTSRGIMLVFWAGAMLAGAAIVAMMLRDVYGRRTTITMTRSAVCVIDEFLVGRPRMREAPLDEIGGVECTRQIASFTRKGTKLPLACFATDSREIAEQAAAMMRESLRALSPDAA